MKIPIFPHHEFSYSKQAAMRWFYGYLKKYTWRIVIGLILGTVTSVLAVVNPNITGHIVDDVIGDGTNIRFELLPRYITLMLAVTLVRGACRLVYLYMFERSSQDMLYDMRDGVYRNLMQKDFSFYNRNRTGDLMSRQTGDMMALRHFVAMVIHSLYENALLFVTALVMIFSVDWRIGLAMVVVLPFTLITTTRQSASIHPRFMKVRDCFSSLNAFVQENISGNRVVRAFAKEDYEISRFDRENAAYRDAELDATKIWVKYIPIFEILSNLLSVILMIVGGIMCVSGAMSLGKLVMINGYLWMLNMPLRMIGWLINDYQRFQTSVQKIYSTIQDAPGIVNPAKPEVTEQNGPLKGEVEFRNVSYTVNDVPILKDISFHVKPGETVGILGETGSGKTTIMNLICRFYDVSGGAVLVDGVDVRNYDLHTLRRNIGMAMQDVFLFSDSVEGNIAYGVPDCPEEQVEWAARLSDADGFIREMADGYDTVVGERGIGLSGGQKQRISLARAIIRKPSIIILDDTTSAVDMETEAMIQKSLKTLSGETVFIIAQRISSIKDADQIFVIEDGRIADRGTHSELVSRDGYYRTVFLHQYGEFGAKLASSGTGPKTGAAAAGKGVS